MRLMSRGSRARATVTALGVALSVVAVGAPATLAGAPAPSTTILASNSPCLDGIHTVLPSGDTAVNVQLWSSGGTLQDSEVSNLDGDTWSTCLDVSPTAGKRVDVRSDPGGVLLASLTIPTLSAKTDRATDVVRGLGPRHKTLKIRVLHCSITTTSKHCPLVGTRTVTVDGAGKYTKDLTSAHDLRGMDEVEVRHADASGDRFTLYVRIPTLYVHVDTKVVSATLRPNTIGKFRLLSAPGGTLLSSRTATANDHGQTDLEFTKLIKAGRQVRSDIATDAVVTIVPVSVRMVVVGDDQVIKARCLPDRRMLVDFQADVRVLTADHQGRASLVSPVELDSNPLLNVYCQTSKGDVLHVGVGGSE